jgi:hypothetical protein
MWGLSPKIKSEFAEFNSLSVSKVTSAGKPSSEIDQREYKPGALKCPGIEWYHFTCLLESLYMTNITTQQTVYLHGDLLKEITATTHRSIPLRECFAKCFPPLYLSQQNCILLCLLPVDTSKLSKRLSLVTLYVFCGTQPKRARMPMRICQPNWKLQLDTRQQRVVAD